MKPVLFPFPVLFPSVVALSTISVVLPVGTARGQSEYSAQRGNALSRFTLGATASPLGIGPQLATNAGTRVDVRLFGNYTNLTYGFTRSGFRINLNVGMANAGAQADFYPLRRIPLRISPGFLYFNQNRIAAGLRAGRDATFTINNVEHASDNADPVYGTGRLLLGGRGFMATAGYGMTVSRTSRRFTFPFEAGVVLIDRPVAQFNLLGHVCTTTDPIVCRPAAQFPAFAQNLAAQVANWNRRIEPFHIYPIVKAGVAYTFSLRGGGVE